MKVIAIHYGHNATVGIAEGGDIKALLSEERISRIKNATGYPAKALEYMAGHYLGGSLNGADMIVLPGESLGGYLGLKKRGFEARPYTEPYYATKKKDVRRLCSDSLKKKIRSFFGLGFVKSDKEFLTPGETL